MPHVALHGQETRMYVLAGTTRDNCRSKLLSSRSWGGLKLKIRSLIPFSAATSNISDARIPVANLDHHETELSAKRPSRARTSVRQETPSSSAAR